MPTPDEGVYAEECCLLCLLCLRGCRDHEDPSAIGVVNAAATALRLVHS